MSDWMKLSTDVGTGLLVGAGDQLIQNQDEKRALAERAAGTLPADKKLPVMKQYGTLFNYGVPLVIVGAIAMNALRGDWATRLATAAGQLAGRKVTHQFTTKSTSPYPSAAYTQWQREKAMERAAHAARSYQPEMESAHAF